jgi:hypothetical protein
MLDLMDFGRLAIQMDGAELEKHLAYQIGALQGITATGSRVTHVSYHAAFGNMATGNREIADMLARAIARIDCDLIVYSMPDTEVEFAALRAGLRSMTMFLADRAYHENGELVSRKVPNSVITPTKEVAARVSQFLNDGTVTSFEGKRIKMRPKGILVYSDTLGPLELARTVAERRLCWRRYHRAGCGSPAAVRRATGRTHACNRTRSAFSLPNPLAPEGPFSNRVSVVNSLLLTSAAGPGSRSTHTLPCSFPTTRRR